MLDFTQFSLLLNGMLFAVAAAFVWFAGAKLSTYADMISQATGLGQAVVGLVLLAGVTSLPEIGVSISSAVAGDADLAVNNLFGSVAMQVTILALIDFYIGRRALTSVLPDPTLMLQGGLNILLLSIAAAGIVVGDIAIAGIGVWSYACLAAYVGAIWLLSQSQGRKPWLASHSGPFDSRQVDESLIRSANGEPASGDAWPLKKLIIRTAVAAVVILIAGFVLSRTGSAIAQQTGVGSSFVGFVLIAISTSLPELSSALSAARRGRLTMAISDILGTNLINVGLVFLVDAVSAGDLVFNRLGAFATLGALLSIVVTTLFIIGLAERRDRTVGRFGFDSIAVMIAYLGGVAILYSLRANR